MGELNDVMRGYEKVQCRDENIDHSEMGKGWFWQS
jgi:hypothetical protein